MNLRNRLKKLEQVNKPEQMPLVMIKFNDEWTSEQQKQIDQARAKKSPLLIVKFI